MSGLPFPGGRVDLTDRFRSDDTPPRTTVMGPVDRVVADLLDLEEGTAVAATTACDIEYLQLAASLLQLTLTGVGFDWSVADPTAERLMTVRAPGLKTMAFASLEGETREAQLKRLMPVVLRWAGVL